MPAELLKYSPSGASRWLKCHASVPRAATLPPAEKSEDDDQYRDEGRRFHLLIAAMVQGDPIPDDLEYDEEMLRHAEAYVAEIDTWRMHPDFERDYVEESISHGRLKGLEGTLDYLATFQDLSGRHARIADAKYGAGQYVAAANNEQLLCYALLADAYAGPFGMFTLSIYQPRCGDEPWRHWSVSREELLAFAERVFWAMAEKSHVELGGHCKWCPFLPHCDDVADQALQLAAEDVQADEDIDRWTRILAVAPAIKAMLDAVSAKVSRAIQAGKQVPGWKVVQGNPGPRRWRIKDQAELEQELRALKLRPKDFVEKKILSPPQLEKKGFFDIISHLVERPAGGPTLVPETDPRESIITTADDFEAL